MSERLPFNPGRMKAKQTGERAGARDDQSLVSVLGKSQQANQALSVTQLASQIEHALKKGLPSSVVLIGEVSSVSHRTHFYFSLKDDQSVISAVMFASAAKRSSYQPTQGDSVIVKGRVDFYAPSGRVSLIVNSIEPVGAGQLEQEFKERCNTLRDRGWFADSHKQTLPMFPQRISVITSKDGAALADVIDTMRRRCPCIELVIVDVRVQGASAAGSISRALKMIDEHAVSLGIDAVILTRGGGSMEDLWAFNEMAVIESVYYSKVPVVAAIGHETDTTIAELVADERCATPTQAAMRLTPDREALHEQLHALHNRLKRAIGAIIRESRYELNALQNSKALASHQSFLELHRHKMATYQQRLLQAVQAVRQIHINRVQSFAIRLARHQPSHVHARREERIELLEERLKRTIMRSLQHSRERLDAHHRELRAVGPAQVLARGYSVTTRSNGKLIKTTEDVAAGDAMISVFSDGKVRSIVQKSDDSEQDPRLSNSQPSMKRSKKQSKNSGDDPDQLGLF